MLSNSRNPLVGSSKIAQLVPASFYYQTNLPGLTLRPRIELILCFDFVLLAPALSTTQRHHATRPQSSSCIEILFPDRNVQK